MPAESKCEDCGRQHALSYQEWQTAWLMGAADGLCGNAGGSLVSAKGKNISWNEDADHEDAICDCLEVTNRRLRAQVKALEAAHVKLPEDSTNEKLDELGALFAKATPGAWKTWALDIMSDQTGDSDVEKAKPVARGAGPRTHDIDLICAMQRALPALLAAARGLNDLRNRIVFDVRRSYPSRVIMMTDADVFAKWLAGVDERGYKALPSAPELNDPLDLLNHRQDLEVCKQQDGYVVITGVNGYDFTPVAFFFDRELAEEYASLEKPAGDDTEPVAFDAAVLEASLIGNRIVCANDFELNTHQALRARAKEAMARQTEGRS